MTTECTAHAARCPANDQRARLHWSLWRHVRSWWRAARARQALRLLNDRMLRDIGMRRADCDRFHEQSTDDPPLTPQPFGRH